MSFARRPDLDCPYVPPRNEVERVIVAIWEKELGIEGIGVHDHFLELGGDSLIAVLISARIHEVLDCDIPAFAFFELPTVAALAAEVCGGSSDLR